MLGGLTMHHPVANFLWCIRAENYEKLLRLGKVIAKKAVCSFFGPLCMSSLKLFCLYSCISDFTLAAWCTYAYCDLECQLCSLCFFSASCSLQKTDFLCTGDFLQLHFKLAL